MLNRTSVSVRGKILLKPKAAAKGEAAASANGKESPSLYQPSMICDPFYSYSCGRPSIQPTHEIDMFVSELLFSLSDRQLEMITQLLNRKISEADQGISVDPDTDANNLSHYDCQDELHLSIAELDPRVNFAESSGLDRPKETGTSWFKWAVNALSIDDNDEDDELVTELLAETKNVLSKMPAAVQPEDTKEPASDVPIELITCIRLCISTTSLTLRKHQEEQDYRTADIAENSATMHEELIPVANLGLVKVPVHKSRSRVSKPATAVCTLSLNYSALEMVLYQCEGDRRSDLVFEIEKVELISCAQNEFVEPSKSILQWGVIDSSVFTECVSHPYFNRSFFGDETRRLNRRETRSFEIVKVSFDAEIPVWKTVPTNQGTGPRRFDDEAPCMCSIYWDGKNIPCVAINKLYAICNDVIRRIGIRERLLDEQMIISAIKPAWEAVGYAAPLSQKLRQRLRVLAHEYGLLRNPECEPIDNLQQLLLPHLLVLFARITYHECDVISMMHHSYSGVSHRSAHSAVRMRISSATSMSLDLKDTISSSRTLDVSFGQADIVLEPLKAAEIFDFFSILNMDDHDDKADEDSNVDSSEDQKLTAKSTDASSQQKEKRGAPKCSNMKLISFSKIQMLVSDTRSQLQSNEVPRYVRLVGSDLVWLENNDGASIIKILRVGEASASLATELDGKTKNTEPYLLQSLGFDLNYSESIQDDIVRTVVRAISADKLKLRVDSLAIDRVVLAGQEFLSSLGKPNMVMYSPTSSHCNKIFQVEVCNAVASDIATIHTHPNLLDKRALDFYVQSTSAWLVLPENRSKSIFQSGHASLLNIDQPPNNGYFITMSAKEIKSSCVSCFVPIIYPYIRSSTTLDHEVKGYASYDLNVSVHIAKVSGLLEGSFDLYTEVNGVVCKFKTEEEDLPSVNTDQIQSEVNHFLAMKQHETGYPAKWKITFAGKFEGGSILLNKLLTLTVPPISIMPTSGVGSEKQHPGGRISLGWNIGQLAITDRNQRDSCCVFNMQGLKGRLNYQHDWIGDVHSHSTDANVSLETLNVYMSRLTVRVATMAPNCILLANFFLCYCVALVFAEDTLSL